MSALAMLYATYIMKGPEYKTFKDVPALLKPQVKDILTEEGFEHLAK
ncbi:hypothetical protein QT711_11210 [Sporosarcina saromensis]|uniref:Uncharacterized protein n=1 Tax=Sporosarcina saromensis TaxID=359365 RepID=A0ABU4GA28_9BACL|nr:hypothetical protein [Sporosarcina saromensis]MDW0113756.1 hypothetical protein [Sporosarcina saromensis]